MRKNSQTAKPKTRKQINGELQRIVDAHKMQLAEFFDAVQIICTTVDPNGTTLRLDSGSGNAFARMKVTEIWLNAVESRVR